MRFLIAFIAGLLPAIVFALVGRQFLANTHETTSYADIIREQRERGGIYSSALRDDFYDYKVALYRAVRPEVIAIGSSRGWGQESQWFRVPFVTLGGGVRTIADAERLFEDIASTGSFPSRVILMTDYWWFNPDYRARPETDSLDELKTAIEDKLGLWFRPARWLEDRKVSPAELLRVAFQPRDLPAPLPPTYGIVARYSWHGFAPDGHYLYLGDAVGKFYRYRGFTDAVNQIKAGAGRYVFGERADRALFDRFIAVVKRFEERGSQVVIVWPPVAVPALEQIAAMGGKLGYIDEVRMWMRSAGLRLHDFHDPRTVGGTDCEFVDAYHAGEVLNARMTLALARDPALAPMIDTTAIETAVTRDRGRVLVDGARFAPHKEIDFLDLGCPK